MRQNSETVERKARYLVNTMRELFIDGRGHRVRWMADSFKAWNNKGTKTNDERARIANIVRFAERGDPYARAACFAGAADFLSDGIEFPPALARYVAEHCRATAKKTSTGGKRGRSRYDKLDRDWAIETAIFLLRSTCEGVTPTRCEASRDLGKGKSACAILSKALEEIGVDIEEENLEKIWIKVRKQMREGTFP